MLLTELHKRVSNSKHDSRESADGEPYLEPHPNLDEYQYVVERSPTSYQEQEMTPRWPEVFYDDVSSGNGHL